MSGVLCVAQFSVVLFVFSFSFVVSACLVVCVRRVLNDCLRAFGNILVSLFFLFRLFARSSLSLCFFASSSRILERLIFALCSFLVSLGKYRQVGWQPGILTYRRLTTRNPDIQAIGSWARQGLTTRNPDFQGNYYRSKVRTPTLTCRLCLGINPAAMEVKHSFGNPAKSRAVVLPPYSCLSFDNAASALQHFLRYFVPHFQNRNTKSENPNNTYQHFHKNTNFNLLLPRNTWVNQRNQGTSVFYEKSSGVCMRNFLS